MANIENEFIIHNEDVNVALVTRRESISLVVPAEAEPILLVLTHDEKLALLEDIAAALPRLHQLLVTALRRYPFAVRRLLIDFCSTL
jgi:hypothetical protein